MGIQVSRLNHYYTSNSSEPVAALSDVNLSISPGEVRGLLGPNGAGKTTLMKILSGLLIPTQGSVSIFGLDIIKDINQIKRLTGIVFGGDRGLYSQLTAKETLEFWASLYNVPRKLRQSRIEALIERFGLASKADSRVETYSRGMKQRLHLARGLISDARVLLFDEPTMGMDPIAARDFRQLIWELKNEGRVVLIATHDMAEAEAVCDQVMLIDRGKILATETPASLARMVSDIGYIEIRKPSQHDISMIAEIPEVVNCRVSLESLRIFVKDKFCYGQVISRLAALGIYEVETKRPRLEDVYIKLIGDRGFLV